MLSTAAEKVLLFCSQVDKPNEALLRDFASSYFLWLFGNFIKYFCNHICHHWLCCFIAIRYLFGLHMHKNRNQSRAAMVSARVLRKTLEILTMEAVFFILLPILLVLINNFPDMTIYSFKSSWNLTKLSDNGLVKENWANYVLSTILVSGVIYYVLLYKTEETIQISKKDDEQDKAKFVYVSVFWTSSSSIFLPRRARRAHGARTAQSSKKNDDEL